MNLSRIVTDSTSIMDGFAIVPPARNEGFVELARSQKGRVFEKQILEFGDLHYPGVAGGTVHIDQAWADTLVKNFNDKVCDIVQVPKAGPNNEHTEDPDRNIGEVIGLSIRNNKVYARIDARDEDAAGKLGKTLLGASAMLHLNYKNTKTNEKVGPTLLHVAVTNRPYVTGLEDYEELLAASADSTTDAVFLTASTDTEDKTMTLDEIFAELKSGHGIDVPALQEKAAGADAAVALSNKIQEELATTGLLKLTNGAEATADDLIGAVAEAGEKLVSLSAQVEELVASSTKKDAIAEVEKLVSTGFILPKDKDAMVELRLSNADLFEKLVPEKPVVKLSVENGSDPVDEDALKLTAASEIERLAGSPAAAAYIRTK